MECIGRAIVAILGFVRNLIREGLIDFLKDRAKEALFFRFKWIVQKVKGTDPTALLANFPHGVVGAEEPLLKTRRLLEDNNSRIIGIYGMGGVGKTTLLKTIHDEYLQTRSERFDIVIFVTVSTVILVENIQEKIGKQLGFEDNFGRDIEDRSTRLFNELRRKRFLLLLDDLWEKLDFAEVGIPHADNFGEESKVVFTTRSRRVCNDMDASHSEIEVPSLSPEKSWELFCNSMRKRDDQWTDSTRTLAQAVVEMCGGLPLALITVGRAMANATTKLEWEGALEAIRDLEAVKRQVLPSLQVSFARLEDENKKCLLYCSLFPKDFSIEVDVLTEYWIGEENVIDSDKCPLDDAREHGLAAITSLKCVSLLEDDSNEEQSKVKLHNMVREMALWITKKTFVGKSGKKLKSARISKILADATKVSLMCTDIEELPERPECHELRTLLLNNNRPLRHIPCEFFQFMPLLTVLDLSHTGIKLLPIEIGLLKSLTFLNLSYTPIESLPSEVGGLKKLTVLKLRRTDLLEEIPKEAISSLSSLRFLAFSSIRYKWRGGWKEDCGETWACFRDLTSLEQLEELDLIIEINYQEDFRGLLNSRQLCSVVRQLHLEELSNSCIDWFGDFEDLNELRELVISNCCELEQMIFPTNKFTNLEKLYLFCLPLKTISWSHVQGGSCFKNLLKLWIKGCESLEHITWVKDIPHLQELALIECTKMEEIIKVEEADVNAMVSKNDNCFPRLRNIELDNMPNLKTICRQVLLFPCLEYIRVSRCPNLKKPQFGSESAKQVKYISGEPLWRDEL